MCRLALAAPGDRVDLADGPVGVVVQLDGLALPGRQVGDGGPQCLGAIQVVGGRHALGRGRVQLLGPVGQQHQRVAAARGPVHVAHDAGQPGAEPVRVAQLAQARERLQERLLHDVVRVVAVPGQPGRAGPGHRPVALDEQPERPGVARAGAPDQFRRR